MVTESRRWMGMKSVDEESSPAFKMSRLRQVKSAAIVDDACATLELIYPGRIRARVEEEEEEAVKTSHLRSTSE